MEGTGSAETSVATAKYGVTPRSSDYVYFCSYVLTLTVSLEFQGHVVIKITFLNSH